ncbi:GNAT family N-acetyltransferase [Rhizobium sp. BR 314]|uniref:GNAT family N-acetyltransferase n=1 Tax=Rhizobium sp. BR 314 TaxID=3040013 RepID=UPI0039BFA4AE
MIAKSISRSHIRTARLTLRPTSVADAQRALEIQSDWDVARMLANATYPADREDMETWFASHELEWAEGTAYRFAIEREGRMIGIVDVDGIAAGEGSLGYWLEKVAWGKGYAFEAAQALIEFAFSEVGLSSLVSGRAVDNPASGHVLTKLGFTQLDSRGLFSRSRGETILQARYTLAR